MNGIEKIALRITQDAQEEIANLKAEAQAQADEILAQYRKQAEREREELLQRGRKQAAERQERLESAADMERRKLELACKQEVLSEAFALALDKLCALDDQEYITILSRLAVRASTTGREQLIFSPADRTRVGKQVVLAANEAMIKQVVPELPEGLSGSKVGALLEKVVNTTSAMITGTGLLTLSEETRPIKGGFIMADGDIEINCAFESLVRLQREQLELEVAKVLFP